MIIQNISKAKQDFRKDICKNLKLMPKYVGTLWGSLVLSAILYFYIEECYFYVPVANPNSARCRELCRNMIIDLFTNETTTTSTTATLKNESISTNKTLINNNFERLTSKCMEQCQGDNNYSSIGPSCSFDATLWVKWIAFCSTTAFTIGEKMLYYL